MSSSLPASVVGLVAVVAGCLLVPAIISLFSCMDSRQSSISQAPLSSNSVPHSSTQKEDDRREAIHKALITKKITLSEPKRIDHSSARPQKSNRSIKFSLASVARPPNALYEQHREQNDTKTATGNDGNNEEGQNHDTEAGSQYGSDASAPQRQYQPNDILEAIQKIVDKEHAEAHDTENLPAYDDEERNGSISTVSHGTNGKGAPQHPQQVNDMEVSLQDEDKKRIPHRGSQYSWKTSNFVARKLSTSIPGFGSLLDPEQPTGCSICLMYYEVGEEVCRSPNPACHHEFHKECMVNWLMKNKESPICRRDYLGCKGDRDSLTNERKTITNA